MGREDAPHQAQAAGGERERPLAAIAGARLPAHQPPPDQLVHHVGGAAALDEDPPLHLAHRQPALVIEDLEHPELGGAEVEPGDTGPGVALDRVERSRQDDPEPQGRVTRGRGEGGGGNRRAWHHLGNLPAGDNVPKLL